MIRGSVSENLDLLVTIEVSDIYGVFRSLEVVLDTGFNGYLILPEHVIQSLRLTYRGQVSTRLASGQEEAMSNYDAVVSWHGQTRDVEVLAAEGGALVGMALLLGSKLTVDARTGGEVLIEEAPPSP